MNRTTVFAGLLFVLGNIVSYVSAAPSGEFYMPELQEFHRGRRYNEEENKRLSAQAALEFKTNKFFRQYRGKGKSEDADVVNPNFDSQAGHAERISQARNMAKCAALQRSMGDSVKIVCNSSFSPEKFRREHGLDSRMKAKKRSGRQRKFKVRASHRMKKKGNRFRKRS